MTAFPRGWALRRLEPPGTSFLHLCWPSWVHLYSGSSGSHLASYLLTFTFGFWLLESQHPLGGPDVEDLRLLHLSLHLALIWSLEGQHQIHGPFLASPSPLYGSSLAARGWSSSLRCELGWESRLLCPSCQSSLQGR